MGYRSREATQPQANCKLLIRVCPLVYKGTPAWEAEGENILASSAVAFRPWARLPISVLGTLHSDFTIHILRTPCLQLNRMQQLLVAGVFGLLVSPGVPLPHRMPACQGSATSGDTGRSQLGLRIAAGGRRPLAGPNTGAVGNPKTKWSAAKRSRGQELARAPRSLPIPLHQTVPAQLGKWAPLPPLTPSKFHLLFFLKWGLIPSELMNAVMAAAVN